MLKNDYFCETAGLGIRRNNIGAAGGNQQDTTVTLTAAPDEGYQLASPVTVKAAFAPIGSAALPRPYLRIAVRILQKRKNFCSPACTIAVEAEYPSAGRAVPE